MTAAPVLEAVAVAKRYGVQPVLQDLSLRLAGPEAVALVGPNGAGKTTLLRILAGLIRPDTGAVRYAGMVPPGAFRHHPIGYFGGEPTLPPAVRVNRWLQLLQSDGRSGEDRRRFRTLSRGTRQWIGLRSVLQRPSPRVILLDEPWEGLDPDASRWLTHTLRVHRDKGAAIIVSSHRLEELVDLCDRFAFLMGGTLTCCTAAELCRHGRTSLEDLLAVYDRLRGTGACDGSS